jgi:hypothetical protein
MFMSIFESITSHLEPNHSGKTETSHSALGDFFDATVIAAVEDPLNAGEQMINHATGKHLPKLELVDRPRDTWAAKAGSAVGNIIDVALIGAAAATGVAEVGLAAGVGTSVLTSAAVGLVYSASRPTSETGNFWANKARDVAITTGTFAALGALAPELGKLSFLGKAGSRTLIQDTAVSGISGLPAGAVNAELTSVLNGHGLATMREVANKSAQFALYGAAMGFGSHVVASAYSVGKTAVQEATHNEEVTRNEEATHNDAPAQPLTKFNETRNGFKIQFDDKGNVKSLQYSDPDPATGMGAYGKATLEHLVTPVTDPETGNTLWQDQHTVHVEEHSYGSTAVQKNPDQLLTPWQKYYSPTSPWGDAETQIDVTAKAPFELDPDGKGITITGLPVQRTLLAKPFYMKPIEQQPELMTWTETAKEHMRLGEYQGGLTITGAPTQAEVDAAISKTYPDAQKLDDGQVREFQIPGGLKVFEHFNNQGNNLKLITSELFNKFPHAQHIGF